MLLVRRSLPLKLLLQEKGKTMKISVVRNKLIKQSVIVFSTVTILGGVLWYISSLNDENDASINSLNSQVNSVSKQASDLSAEYSKVNSVMDDYLMIKEKQQKKMLDIDKNALRDAMAEVRDKRNLEVSEVKINDIKELSGAQYKLESAYIEAGNITISTKSLSDLDVFYLIKTLGNRFSGIKFSNLNLTLAKDINDSALAEIRKSGFVPIVESKMNFTIFGIRDVNIVDDELKIGGGNGTAQPPVTGRP